MGKCEKDCEQHTKVVKQQQPSQGSGSINRPRTDGGQGVGGCWVLCKPVPKRQSSSSGSCQGSGRAAAVVVAKAVVKYDAEHRWVRGVHCQPSAHMQRLWCMLEQCDIKDQRLPFTPPSPANSRTLVGRRRRRARTSTSASRCHATASCPHFPATPLVSGLVAGGLTRAPGIYCITHRGTEDSLGFRQGHRRYLWCAGD